MPKICDFNISKNDCFYLNTFPSIQTWAHITVGNSRFASFPCISSGACTNYRIIRSHRAWSTIRARVVFGTECQIFLTMLSPPTFFAYALERFFAIPAYTAGGFLALKYGIESKQEKDEPGRNFCPDTRLYICSCRVCHKTRWHRCSCMIALKNWVWILNIFLKVNAFEEAEGSQEVEKSFR